VNVDAIESGLRMHIPLMQRIAKHVSDREELVKIGRMIDILVGSAQVHAVENGLDGTLEQYRSAITEKFGKYILEG
jgi:hypothetical protein